MAPTPKAELLAKSKRLVRSGDWTTRRLLYKVAVTLVDLMICSASIRMATIFMKEH